MEDRNRRVGYNKKLLAAGISILFLSTVLISHHIMPRRENLTFDKEEAVKQLEASLSEKQEAILAAEKDIKSR